MTERRSQEGRSRRGDQAPSPFSPQRSAVSLLVVLLALRSLTTASELVYFTCKRLAIQTSASAFSPLAQKGERSQSCFVLSKNKKQKATGGGFKVVLSVLTWYFLFGSRLRRFDRKRAGPTFYFQRIVTLYFAMSAGDWWNIDTMIFLPTAENRFPSAILILLRHSRLNKTSWRKARHLHSVTRVHTMQRV